MRSKIRDCLSDDHLVRRVAKAVLLQLRHESSNDKPCSDQSTVSITDTFLLLEEFRKTLLRAIFQLDVDLQTELIRYFSKVSTINLLLGPRITVIVAVSLISSNVALDESARILLARLAAISARTVFSRLVDKLLLRSWPR